MLNKEVFKWQCRIKTHKITLRRQREGGGRGMGDERGGGIYYFVKESTYSSTGLIDDHRPPYRPHLRPHPLYLHWKAEERWQLLQAIALLAEMSAPVVPQHLQLSLCLPAAATSSGCSLCQFWTGRRTFGRGEVKYWSII